MTKEKIFERCINRTIAINEELQKSDNYILKLTPSHLLDEIKLVQESIKINNPGLQETFMNNCKRSIELINKSSESNLVKVIMQDILYDLDCIANL